MNKPLISIIIPCFNAELYIKETLESILIQTEQDFEIIVINDGSSDNTVSIIEEIKDDRIKLINQSNSGVSIARNNGLEQSSANYIVFFDADDLMTPKFLSDRVEVLQKNNEVSFVYSDVISFKGFNRNDKLSQVRGAGNNLEEEILFYDSSVSTCPSNYMLRKSDLSKYSISFNPNLSSHADRYFLLELNKCKLRGNYINTSDNCLLYRVLDNSMSHQLSIGLANDAELYYKELEQNSIVSNSLLKKALSKGYYIIGATYFKLGMKVKAIQYLIKGFTLAPRYFMKLF